MSETRTRAGSEAIRVKFDLGPRVELEALSTVISDLQQIVDFAALLDRPKPWTDSNRNVRVVTMSYHNPLEIVVATAVGIGAITAAASGVLVLLRSIVEWGRTSRNNKADTDVREAEAELKQIELERARLDNPFSPTPMMPTVAPRVVKTKVRRRALRSLEKREQLQLENLRQSLQFDIAHTAQESGFSLSQASRLAASLPDPRVALRLRYQLESVELIFLDEDGQVIE